MTRPLPQPAVKTVKSSVAKKASTASAASSKKPAHSFTIDCTKPAEDQILCVYA